MKNPKRRQRPTTRLPLWAVGLIIFVGVILLGLSTFWLFKTVQGVAASLTPGDGLETPLDLEDEDAGPAPGEEGVASESPNRSPLVSAATAIAATPTPAAAASVSLSPDDWEAWSGRERVSILLLGTDLRCDEEGPTHTDTVMVITVDPVGRSAAVLSLPRDLWVEIPGFGVDRINQAYFKGEAYEYPGGGPALAIETVEATLGVPIDYYAAVNFEAVTDFIDLIGGITVEVSESIEDPKYPDNCYGYDPFYLSAGTHELDGQRTLKYARTRATMEGDVDRAARQQQVAMAARDKILRINMIPRLLVQAPQLWSSFRRNIDTNMSLEEMIQLGLLAQEIPRDNIRLAVLDFNYVYNETTPTGQQVLVPRRDNIRALRDELFAPPAIPTPVIEDLPQLMRREDARIVVHNGTSVSGLAGETRDYLRELGFDVVDVGNANAAYPTTQVVDFGSHPATTNYLTRVLEVPALNISYSSQPGGDYDVLVIVGDDWRMPGSEEASP